MTHIAEALLDEERRRAAVLRAVRREELVLEWNLDRELRAMRGQRVYMEHLDSDA